MLSRIEHAMSLTDQLRSLPTAEPRLDGWADVHILFGAVFILAGIWHLYFHIKG